MTETVTYETTGRGPADLAVVGAGRAGAALATAAAAAGRRVTAIASRDPAHAETLARAVGARQVTGAAQAARSAELTLLAVPDAAVTGIAARLAACGAALSGRAIAHCSASLGPEAIAALRQTGAAVAVMHPLQALAGAPSADLLAGSAFRVEGDATARPVVEALVADLHGFVLEVPSQARALYHAAAVLAGNAPLALLERAVQLLIEAGVDAAAARRALASLLLGTATNARRQGAAAALTGPVVRDDSATVRAHLDALAVDADTRDLYLRLSQEILTLAGAESRADTEAVLRSAAAGPRPGLAGRRVA